VKDWQPGLYHSKIRQIKDKLTGQYRTVRQFYVKVNGREQPILNPQTQVNSYRHNLIGLYIPDIGEAIDSYTPNLTSFKLAVYFHKMTTNQAIGLMQTNPSHCSVFGHDTLKSPLNSEMARVAPDMNRIKHSGMREEWSKKIRFWLIPPFHSIEQGTKLVLNEEQKRHAEPAPGKHQRLRGVAGSGKTLVLAQRAAMLASQGKRVLVVTYNITLWHYVKDHIERACYNFNRSNIQFAHYHGFCRNMLYANDVPWPSDVDEEAMFESIIPQMVIDIANSSERAKRAHQIFDAILIDEGQDFNLKWYEMLCKFLTDNDELLMVFDEKQNIYGKSGSWIEDMKGTKFRGRWRTLNESYRLPPSVMEKANEYARSYLPEIGAEAIPNNYQISFFEPHMIWKEIEDADPILEIWNLFNELTEEKSIHPQDIIMLVPTHKEGWKLVEHFTSNGIEVNHVFEDESKNHHNKRSFWMGDSRLKMSTIHSFKGWELMNIVLLMPKPEEYEVKAKLDKIVYTSITRTRANLIVLNRHPRYRDYGKTWPRVWEN